MFSQSENLIKTRARAKYIRQADGSLRLVQVQRSSLPIFSPPGWEARDGAHERDETVLSDETEGKECDVARASRRAKIAALDFILANPCLDTFGTLTYAPDAVEDKASYADVYRPLRGWLSNRVQRRDLRYLLVPERHKSGAIHFHFLANGEALTLERAHSPYTGRPLENKGRAIYNITDWPFGFSTAERVEGGAGDRDAVAKYIFKYMGKQSGAKIGGRYFLHGGELAGPVYAYAEDPREFLGSEEPKNHFTATAAGGIEYEEWDFV